ncbi:MAG: 16S rRNA (adenine(1518)-N(6)/adenine(1519)-N(6))-dimethyltransferase RsmA [Planctomycetota bacterium]|nr:16S rRNA (adenine(1518)-N(6)/adenine(1519)-N(6))-dimethyltransferase RsmA [Planctomycetota bacterium]
MGIRRELRGKLDRAGIRPSTRRGQNFLIDSRYLDFISGAAELSPADVVLEVGPGTGLLTRRLAASGCRLLAVELDRGLFRMAREETASFPNVRLIQGDILAGKRRLNPEIEIELGRLLAEAAGERQPDSASLKCVSNLPYSSGAAFIMNLLSSPLPWRSGTFLLQREAAERLIARPEEDNYGALSVRTALAARARVERLVPPAAFWPVPKVESAILRLEPYPAPERLSLPRECLDTLLKAVFGARRKTLKNAIKNLTPPGEEAENLEKAGFDPRARGERLTPEEFLALARNLTARGKIGRHN